MSKTVSVSSAIKQVGKIYKTIKIKIILLKQGVNNVNGSNRISLHYMVYVNHVLPPKVDLHKNIVLSVVKECCSLVSVNYA